MLAIAFWLASLAWLVGSTGCAMLQPRRRRFVESSFERAPVTAIVPTSTVDSSRSAEDRVETLSSLLQVDYPEFEILVCADRVDGSASVLDAVDALFGDKGVRTAAAPEAVSPNAKIDAMEIGLGLATNDLILFCDDDVSVDPQHLAHLVFQLRGSTRLVSAAAIGVRPANLWGHLECSFMNGQFARLHLAGDFMGFSGALGKTVLIHRAEVRRIGGLLPAGIDCCEDAALTRIIKKAGGSVVLSDLPVRQPIRQQSLPDVLRRHRRWLSCRRKYLPLLFIAEGLFCPAVTAVAAALVAADVAGRPVWGIAATLTLWCLVDCLFAASHRYLALASPLAWLIREAVFVPLWLSALFARTVVWYGRRVPVSARSAN